MPKIVIAQSTPPGPAAPGTMVIYANDNTFWAVDEFDNRFRLPARLRNEEPLGTKDGVNDTFVVPAGRTYIPQSLTVFLNGIAYNLANIMENAGYSDFTISGDNLPNADDSLTITYNEGL